MPLFIRSFEKTTWAWSVHLHLEIESTLHPTGCSSAWRRCREPGAAQAARARLARRRCGVWPRRTTPSRSSPPTSPRESSSTTTSRRYTTLCHTPPRDPTVCESGLIRDDVHCIPASGGVPEQGVGLLLRAQDGEGGAAEGPDAGGFAPRAAAARAGGASFIFYLLGSLNRLPTTLH